MSYAQWVEMNIAPVGLLNIKIKNAQLNCGKFYHLGDKNNEIYAEEIDKMIVSNDQPIAEATICSCGRSDAAMGTDGEFTMYDDSINIGTVYWSCPWGSKTNSLFFSPASDEYIVQITGGNFDSGALGNVKIKVAKTS